MASNSSLTNCGRSLSLFDERRGMLLHQVVQRALFRAMTLVVNREAIGRPLRLPADGLHARLPNL